MRRTMTRSQSMAIVAQDEKVQNLLKLRKNFVQSLFNRWIPMEQLIQTADTGASGEIEFEEFASLCKKTLRVDFNQDEMRQLFNILDKDNSGTVSSEELTAAFDLAIDTTIEDMTKVTPPVKQRTNTKLVALVAHNNMKPILLSFVSRHRDFFSRVCLVTTGSTGSMLRDKLGITISETVASGPLGGDQEIGGMVTNNKVAAAFFFIDPLSAHPHEADIRALTRICEVHNCASATNPITGDALVYAFCNSDTHKKKLEKDCKRYDSLLVSKYKDGQRCLIRSVNLTSDEETKDIK